MNEALRRAKAEVFQALAHPSRIAVIDALREGEMTAGRLATLLSLEQANLSQHLAVLRSKHVVVTRKAGNQVYYAVRDPVLFQVLDLLRQYFQSHLSDTLALFNEARAETV